MVQSLYAAHIVLDTLEPNLICQTNLTMLPHTKQINFSTNQYMILLKGNGYEHSMVTSMNKVDRGFVFRWRNVCQTFYIMKTHRPTV